MNASRLLRGKKQVFFKQQLPFAKEFRALMFSTRKSF